MVAFKLVENISPFKGANKQNFVVGYVHAKKNCLLSKMRISNVRMSIS